MIDGQTTGTIRDSRHLSYIVCCFNFRLPVFTDSGGLFYKCFLWLHWMKPLRGVDLIVLEKGCTRPVYI